MFALGLQGSPRTKGNSDLLLAAFMDALARHGALTHTIQVARGNIEPCKELTVCEKKGICPIEDGMATSIYGLLRRADIIVVASPVFFYNVTAQLKALIDRCQLLWARKYMLNLKDPGHRVRRGVLLSTGATRGKQLFDGIHLTVKYFFDAVSARYAGHLTYRNVERRGAILSQKSMPEDVEQLASKITHDLTGRQKVLFTCRENACRSQMAAAFARLHASDRLDVECAGSEPAAAVNKNMVAAMQEKDIDMAHLAPRPLSMAVEQQPPDEIITMGCAQQCPVIPGARRHDWDLPDPSGQSIDVMRSVRDQIEQQVQAYLETRT
jgi:multimeric flavodoxin WrbA